MRVSLQRRLSPIRALSPVRRLADLPIAAKVTLAPAVALLALGALSLFGNEVLDRYGASLAREYRRLEPVLIRSLSLPNHLADIEQDLYRLSLDAGPDAEPVEVSVAAVRRRLDLAGADIAGLKRTGIEGAAELVYAFGGYRRSVSQALLLVEQDRPVGATAVLATERKFDDVKRRARRVAARALRDFRRATEGIERNTGALVRDFTLGALGAGLVVLLTSALASLAITAPARLPECRMSDWR